VIEPSLPSIASLPGELELVSVRQGENAFETTLDVDGSQPFLVLARQRNLVDQSGDDVTSCGKFLRVGIELLKTTDLLPAERGQVGVKLNHVWRFGIIGNKLGVLGFQLHKHGAAGRRIRALGDGLDQPGDLPGEFCKLALD
jgi:hypothetical protein